MKFFADTAVVDEIAELNELGIIDGVTTNPSLILKSGRDILEVTKEICDLVDGPVSAEVVATEASEMIKEGRKLAKLADNITVKVPLTWDGLKTCKTLSSEGTMVNVTLCFSANQALIAAKAGASIAHTDMTKEHTELKEPKMTTFQQEIVAGIPAEYPQDAPLERK